MQYSLERPAAVLVIANLKGRKTDSISLKCPHHTAITRLQVYISNVFVGFLLLHRAENWTLRAADQKYLESFEIWCYRRMENISWTDHVRNEEVLLRVNEQRNILHEITEG